MGFNCFHSAVSLRDTVSGNIWRHVSISFLFLRVLHDVMIDDKDSEMNMLISSINIIVFSEEVTETVE